MTLANPSSHRLRTGRRSEAQRIYLITIKTYRRIPFFNNLTAGRIVVKALQQTADAADTLCFVVMPDHLHWLMQLKDGAELSATVQKAKSITTRQLHARHQHPEQIWQRGFHDRALRSEDDIHR
tara:strand:- start:1985 stop:2356 length:372 start_codon:yes stop_codon:yes gene_type:complete